MTALWIALAVVSLIATVILANLMWTQFRETRAFVAIVDGPGFLEKAVTAEFLKSPPPEAARFAPPNADYGLCMQADRQAHEIAHSRGRAILRPLLAIVVIGSGVVGFLGLGWLGLAVPVVNLLIMQTTFIGSTKGAISTTARDRSLEHVRILALIFHRWFLTNTGEALVYAAREPPMQRIFERVVSLHPVAER